MFFSDGELITGGQTGGSPSSTQMRKKWVWGAVGLTPSSRLGKEDDVKALQRRGSISRNAFKMKNQLSHQFNKKLTN